MVNNGTYRSLPKFENIQVVNILLVTSLYSTVLCSPDIETSYLITKGYKNTRMNLYKILKRTLNRIIMNYYDFFLKYVKFDEYRGYVVILEWHWQDWGNSTKYEETLNIHYETFINITYYYELQNFKFNRNFIILNEHTS